MPGARVLGATLWGVEGRLVQVEAVIGRGLPAWELVGLPDSAAREAKQRVRAALRQLGVALPTGRITINLAPAELRKQGAACDLAIAVCLLAAAGRCAPRGDAVYVGELALDGSVRPVRGLLSMALAARRGGMRALVCPWAAEREVGAVPGLTALPIAHLADLLEGRTPGTRPHGAGGPPAGAVDPGAVAVPDWGDVAGQAVARRVLEVAAAGGHHVLLVGPPGVGKTLLIRGLPGVLPPLADDEALEVAAIADAAGLLPPGGGLARRRPFRAPHHSASVAALVGGGNPPLPGEITLAHRGVLFLDELPLFRRDALDALRQPLEEGVVRLSRSDGPAVLPARIQLVAAMNPCPCGHAGEESGPPCGCTAAALRRYRQTVAGALRDRIDMVVRLTRGDAQGQPGEPSASVRRRVAAARQRQRERLGPYGAACNGELGPLVRRLVETTPAAARLWQEAWRRFDLSPRAADRLLAVARTVADLAGSDVVREDHVAEAVQYRVGPLPA